MMSVQEKDTGRAATHEELKERLKNKMDELREKFRQFIPINRFPDSDIFLKGEGPLRQFNGGGGVHVHSFEAVVRLLCMQPLFGLYFQNPDFFFTPLPHPVGCHIFEKKSQNLILFQKWDSLLGGGSRPQFLNGSVSTLHATFIWAIFSESRFFNLTILYRCYCKFI